MEGDVRVPGRLRVDGTVRGDVHADGPLDVGGDGSVTADRVCASDVRILGDVRGDVHATGAVRIWRGGRLTGDVFAATLDIEEGAVFTGRSHVPTAAEPSGGAGGAEPVAPTPVAEGAADGA